MVQEALTNIVKHAHAENVSIVFTDARGVLTALVEDDGQGFDVAAAREGMGLDGMRERLGLLGGRLRLESSAGSGTSLVAEIPLA
jgi:signal transduction histidine kinase